MMELKSLTLVNEKLSCSYLKLV